MGWYSCYTALKEYGSIEKVPKKLKRYIDKGNINTPERELGI